MADAQPAHALEDYARAKTHGDDCADQGLDTASTNQRLAVEDAARGEADERASDIPAATAAYQAALHLDVTNTLAVAGLARLGHKPVQLPPVTTQPPEPSWWARPWPYFLVLISALFAGAMLWLKNRLGRLEKQSAIRAKALEGALRDLTAVAVEADRARAKLDRTLRRQEKRIDHLTELIDVFAQTQAEPTRGVVVSFKPRSDAGAPAIEGTPDDDKANGTEGGTSADRPMREGEMRVEVSIFTIGSGRGQPGEKRVILQRVITRAVERDDADKIDPSTGYDREARPAEQESGPFVKAGADSIADLVWEQVEAWWVTPDYQSLAAVAEWVQGVDTGLHDLVLGKPVECIALGAGFSPASVEVMGMIAAKVGLPGDNTLKDVRRLLQFTGIVLGVVSGAAPLANACMSSLAHDLLAETMAKAFRAAIGHVLEAEPGVERPIPATELGPEGARAQHFTAAVTHELAVQERVAQELAVQERVAQELAVQERVAQELAVQERAAQERAAHMRQPEPAHRVLDDGPSLGP